MKTITITIQVPDGVQVQVGGAPTRQADNKPFVRQPDPPYPGGSCPVHGEDWKLIKGGVSKTKVDENGNPKPFNGFYVCPINDCDQKPPRPGDVVVEADLPF